MLYLDTATILIFLIRATIHQYMMLLLLPAHTLLFPWLHRAFPPPNLCHEQLLRAVVNDGSSEGWVVIIGTRTRDPVKKCKIS
jgi:hypothetical protein